MTRFCNCPTSLASSLELSRKRNQLAEVSCKTCGGRFLVDGIGPLSRNMFGIVGLEVPNSINPELSWKPVTKGKRTRKTVARRLNGCVGLGSKSPKRVGDFSGSDSDKFGETGIGLCFPDKDEYIPIKKRRHFLHSPSPSPSSRPSLYGGESVSPELQTSSPHSDDCEHLSDHNGSAGSYTNRRGSIKVRAGNDVDDGVVGDKISVVSDGELYDSEHFSGIALLAAAACINNIDGDPCNDEGDVKELSSAPQRSDASTSSLPVRESTACSDSGKQIHKLESKGCSFIEKGSAAPPHSSDENEEGVALKSVSTKVDRRHWDLNTLMDAWEQPNDGADDHFNCLDVSTNGIVKLEKEGCAIQMDSRDNGNDAENSLPLDQFENVMESSALEVKKNESEEFLCYDRSTIEETNLMKLKDSMGPLYLSSADTNSSMHALSSNEFIDDLALSESCHSSEVSGGNMDTKPSSMAITPGEDTCWSLNTPTKHDVALPKSSNLEKFQCQNDGQLKDAEETRNIAELPDTRTASREDRCTGTCSTLDVENSESTSAENSHLSSKCVENSESTYENSHLSSKCEGLSASDISVGGQSAVFCDAKDQDEKVLTANTMGSDAGVHSGSEELLFKHEDHHASNGEAEGRSSLQDSGNDDCRNSDFSQDDQCHMDDKNNTAELQVGYDSPYEDGELRGSVLYSWEGNEIEDGVHGRGGEDSDAGEYPGSKIIEAGSEGSQGTETKRSLATHVRETDSRSSSSLVKGSLGREFKENKEKIETVGKKVANQGSLTTGELAADVILERNDGEMRRCHTYMLDVKRSYEGEKWSKSTRGKLQSRIEGPSSLDPMERDTVYTQQTRSRNSGCTYSRAQRDGTPDRFLTKYRSVRRERNGGDGQLVYWDDSRSRYLSSHHGPEGHGLSRQRSSIADSVENFGGATPHDQKQSINYSSRTERDSTSDRLATRYRSAVRERERIGGDSEMVYWESRSRYQSGYHGSEGHWPTKTRSDISDSVDKSGGLNTHDNKQSISYSSRSAQRPLGWRRPSIDRDYYHGGQRRIAGFNNMRNRGDSRNFPEGVDRGLREEFHQPVNDDGASSVRVPQLSWRERNYSSPSTRGAGVSVPRRTSRSRSRTRSPRAWQPQRERNLGIRHHSRSPDFRSEARTERMRAPCQKPIFAADYEESFMSPPRGRFSPQRNYRGVDDRNFVGNNLRHRRSPFNVFRQSQGLDSIGLSGHLKSDDTYRPMTRRGRFPSIAGVGRGCKLEDDSGDDKRHDDRLG